MEIKGRLVVVTGGASGIGRALAARFHAEGARTVVVADRNADGAQAVARAIGGLAVACDVTKEDDVRRLVAISEAASGPIDLFCSNAGLSNFGGCQNDATSQTNDQWTVGWEVNVMAHVYAARACLPGMIARGRGGFLHTISAAGLLTHVGNPVYSATKHAALGFAESLAITHRDQGVHVSVLCPQAVSTGMLTGREGAHGVDGVMTPEDVATCAVEGLQAGLFMILPHPQVKTYFMKKAENCDRWIGGMAKLRRGYTSASGKV